MSFFHNSLSALKKARSVRNILLARSMLRSSLFSLQQSESHRNAKKLLGKGAAWVLGARNMPSERL
jgi:hypothetical protein